MAKTIAALPKELKQGKGRKKKYPELTPQGWLNGKIWAIEAKDLPDGSSLKKFATSARITANKEKLGLSVNWSPDEKICYIQAKDLRAKKTATPKKTAPKKSAKRKSKTPF